MPLSLAHNSFRTPATRLAMMHPSTANLHALRRVSQLQVPVAAIDGDLALPPWLADGVVYQLPQSWILGFTTISSAIQYMINVYGYAYYSQLWRGYWPAVETPEFTVNDVFTVMSRVDNKPTLSVWFSRNALPYAKFIMKTSFGFQPTSQAGPIVPALELSPFSADSSMGTVSINLQYVQYVPDAGVTSGNLGWVATGF